MRRATIFLTPFALLAGCAVSTRDGFPSLAPRAAERTGFEEPALPPASAVQPDPELDARIAALSAAPGRQPRFVAARAAAETKVAAASGAPQGSTAWLDAEVALGSLDVARSEASASLTALEQLASDRGVAGEPIYPALESALTAARARLADVDATVAALGARLSR